MAPDLNTLPPSSPAGYHSRTMNNPTSSNGEAEASPPVSRSASISLQAAATMNAGLQHEPSRRSSSSSLRNRQSPHTGANRRRSTVLMNLQHNDPSIPGPGEMIGEGHTTSSPQPLSGSPLLSARGPYHNRTPSLGELHQELEAEQEAQVNRLLLQIRQQQAQIQQYQAAHGQNPSTAAVEDTPPAPSGRSSSAAQHPTLSSSTPRSPVLPHQRASFDVSRGDLRLSRTSSHGTPSPRVRSASISAESGDPWSLGGRDESAFYQAETQSLVRENQMLRHRIRELERQLSELHTTSTVTREPSQHSHLHSSTSASGEGEPSGPSTSAVTT